MKLFKMSMLSFTLFAATAVYADSNSVKTQVHVTNTINSTQLIANINSQPSVQGAVQYFTGKAIVNPLFNMDEPSRTVAYVTFDAGARSAWHTHPKGQLLVVTAGIGRTQVWGGKVIEIKPGDVIWCPPNVKHWHGAAPNMSMTHLSVVEDIEGKNVK